MIISFFKNLFRDLYRQPLRTVLTLSGVVWGTFAIVLLLAFGSSVQKQSMKSMRGRSIVIVWPQRTTIPYKGFTKGKRVRVTPQDVLSLKQKIPEIRQASPEYVEAKRIRFKTEELLNSVRGINVEYRAMRKTIPAKGRWLNETDMQNKRRVCFLGNTIAENLFHDEEPVGKQIIIEGVPFTVIGVMIKKIQNGNYSGQFDEHCAFMPWTTFEAIFGMKYVRNFIFRPRDSTKSKEVILKVRDYLGNMIGFSPKDKDALFIWDDNDIENSMKIFFLAFTIFLGLLGGFTLLVGGVGVASIMMVVVEERTREIGIKLAVGAKRKEILWQFFSEGLLIILFGGGIGFFNAALLLNLIPVELIKDYVGIPQINPLVGIVTILALLIIGSISGMIPARRAASTNPVEALRG
jgi:putative ABC transport system permease protein